MKIATRLYLVLLLPLVLLAVVGAVLAWSSRVLDQEAQRENIMDQVTRGAGELNILAYEHLQNSSARTKQQWQRRHDTLVRLLGTVEFPAAADRVALVQARATLEELNHIFAELLRVEDGATSATATSAKLKERLVGRLLAESQSLTTLAASLSHSCARAQVSARQRAFGLTTLLIALTAAGVGVTAWLIRRSITQPIVHLRRGAERLASGHLDHKIGKLADNEIGELARSFDEMAEALRRQAEERDKALAALRLDEERLEALVQLNQMSGATQKQLTDFALETAVSLTGSQIGYLAFMNKDETVLTMHSWSKQAMAECAMEEKPRIYPIASIGLLGEAVRQRKAVITNDYAAPNPLKKGYPKGHVTVLRHMNAPIFDGDRIVAVAGVGNKPTPYDESDVRQLTLLMQGMWRLLKQREIEEDLRRHRDHLEELVADRTAELEQLAAALARSNEELEQFAYIASHDLREPLRMVTGFLQLLEHRYHDKLDADALRFIGFAVDGARRMEQLIQDLLQYARIGSQHKPFSTVDCNQIVQTVLQHLDVAIRENQAVITIEGVLPSVLGDATQLTQLFQNLIANAIKFRRPDTPPRIQIRATRNPTEWVFSVGDNGIGIDPKHFQRLFALFQKLHTREEYPGTGIGLALCKKIVECHGGRIWVESAPGVGSTFSFSLPISAKNPS